MVIPRHHLRIPSPTSALCLSALLTSFSPRKSRSVQMTPMTLSFPSFTSSSLNAPTTPLVHYPSFLTIIVIFSKSNARTENIFLLPNIHSMAKHSIHGRSHSKVNHWRPTQHPIEKSSNPTFPLAYTSFAHTRQTPAGQPKKMPTRAINLIPSL